jgi:tripeptide aminopeptidase
VSSTGDSATSARAPFVSPLAAELAEDVLERLLRYVRIDTQSAHGAATSPSTEKQLDLSRLLRDELEEIGLDDVRLDEHGYVYGSLAGGEGAPAVGLIAHVDTSPDVTGTNVNPLVHRGYDGGRIELPGDPSVVLDPEELPLLRGKMGHDLVTSDGTTLLGADDKAGVAEIMAAVAYLKRNPDPAHAPIRVCFTVDEEVAGGAEHLDLDRFGARYAYTLDGSKPGEIEAETFNASRVLVTIGGRSTHPGTAKGQLVNATKLAAALVASLPRDSLSPETTEEREGFIHPTRISGGAEQAIVELIVRDHDLELMREHVSLIRDLVDELREREPRASIDVQEEEQYRNMGKVIERYPEVIEAAEEAVRRVGLEPVSSIIRGGTDGARLSHRGLPTPNLFTGGSEYHSRREWASVQDMAAAAATIVELARVWAERAETVD